MNRLLDFTKKSDKSDIFEVSSESLDTLYETANNLGKVEISQMGGQHVEITFNRKSGSRIYARGFHSDIREAFRLAIKEARELQ